MPRPGPESGEPARVDELGHLVRLHFGIAAGVRFGQKERKDELKNLPDDNAAEVEAILRRHGVPLVDENGAAL